jgi:hypothetical protein
MTWTPGPTGFALQEPPSSSMTTFPGCAASTVRTRTATGWSSSNLLTRHDPTSSAAGCNQGITAPRRIGLAHCPRPCRPRRPRHHNSWRRTARYRAIGVDCHHSGTDPCTYPCGPIPRNVERERTASICLARSCLDEANIWLYDRMLAGLYWAMGDYIRIIAPVKFRTPFKKTVRGFWGTTIVVFSAYTLPTPCGPGMGRTRMKRILFLQSWTF